MKLLLTSGGIANASIAKALFDLVGKKPEDTSLAYIPTASNVETGDKTWVIEDLVELKKTGIGCIDIADISAVPEAIWRSKLEAADVLYFGGGNTYHLMRWISKSGLSAQLSDLLKKKVYIGVSAGSMVAARTLALRLNQTIFEEDLEETDDLMGLNLVDFYLLPHLNSPYFKNVREAFIREAAKGMLDKIYALDDQSALKIIDKTVEVVTEGN